MIEDLFCSEFARNLFGTYSEKFFLTFFDSKTFFEGNFLDKLEIFFQKEVGS